MPEYGDTRVCNVCRKEKPIDSFALKGKGYREAKCEPCRYRLRTATPERKAKAQQAVRDRMAIRRAVDPEFREAESRREASPENRRRRAARKKERRETDPEFAAREKAKREARKEHQAVYVRTPPQREQRVKTRLEQVCEKNGITVEQYNEMRDGQGGLCAICKQPQKNTVPGYEPGRLAIDHNHQTGAVRGLLCHRCNVGLGVFQDDYRALMRAAAYVLADRSAMMGADDEG